MCCEPKRLTDGQSQRRTAEIRGLGMVVVVGLATNLDALSLLVCGCICSASVLSSLSRCLHHFYTFSSVSRTPPSTAQVLT